MATRKQVSDTLKSIWPTKQNNADTFAVQKYKKIQVLLWQ